MDVPSTPMPAPAPSAMPAGMQLQSVGIRFLALLIDGIIIAVVALIIQFLAYMLGSDENPILAALGSLIIAVGAISYFIYFEGSSGQTLGKKAMGIKVVKEDGSPITMGQAVIRNLLRLIDGLFVYLVGAICIWTSDKKQRLGDMAAHTIVIKV